jgi:hypothetical protein
LSIAELLSITIAQHHIITQTTTIVNLVIRIPNNIDTPLQSLSSWDHIHLSQGLALAANDPSQNSDCTSTITPPQTVAWCYER